MKAALFLMTCTLAAAPLSADCFGEAERQASISAAGIQSVRVIGRSGTLTVQGKAGLTDVRATGKACASTRQLVDQIRIDVSRKGNEIIVEAVIPEEEESIWPFGLGSYARLDMVVDLPANLPVSVIDGSGETWVRDVASADIRDGSGALTVMNVRGNLEVRDGSGSMTLKQISGTVSISDGSGSIDVDGVGGNITLSDGSGSMEVRNVRGNVTVESDGSGSIHVANVGGAFIVENDGSGGIEHAGVRGQVRLPVD